MVPRQFTMFVGFGFAFLLLSGVGCGQQKASIMPESQISPMDAGRVSGSDSRVDAAPDLSADASIIQGGWHWNTEIPGVRLPLPDGWIVWEETRNAKSDVHKLILQYETDEYPDAFINLTIAPQERSGQLQESQDSQWDDEMSDTISIDGVRWERVISRDIFTPLRMVRYTGSIEQRHYTFSTIYSGSSSGGDVNTRNIAVIETMLAHLSRKESE